MAYDYRTLIKDMAHRDEWLAQVQEDVADPDREIIDPHHHLWDRGGSVYEMPQLWEDTSDGHNVVGTMFIECRMGWREDGPEHLKPVGETEYVVAQAARAAEHPDKAQLVGHIAHANLSSDQLDEALDAHAAVAGDLFKGIRHSLSCEQEDAEALLIPGRGSPGLSATEDFRRGVQRLGERGLTYDCWLYHHQLEDYRDLAAACPDTTMILDHFGTPLGVGVYAARKEEIYAKWKDDIAAIAECPNVHAKLGGLAMVDNGFGYHEAATPPSSDQLLDDQAKWYEHTLNCFGADRCMFESNFPVDRVSVGYRVYWNAMKKLVAIRPEQEKAALFSGTARRVYGL